jgi:CIC family chloride channel protein
LRALVRADEVWLVVLSAFVGCGAGIAVWIMTGTTQLIHEVLFGIGVGERLSAMVELDPIRTVVVPSLGGLALGLVGLAVVYYRPRRAVDHIERRRCVDRPRGRLHPDRRGDGLALRPHVPGPTQ